MRDKWIAFMVVGLCACVATCQAHQDYINEQGRQFDRLHPAPPLCGHHWWEEHTCRLGETN